MTEVEWLSAADPQAMLVFLGPHASARKLNLFVLACFDWLREAVERSAGRRLFGVFELFAEGEVDRGYLDAARERWWVPGLDSVSRLHDPWEAARAACDEVRDRRTASVPHEVRDAAQRSGFGREEAWELGQSAQKKACAAEDARHASFLRDIFDPFHAVILSSSWLTPNVRDLARTVYEDRAFEALPILADALMDAGCDSEAILAHCRSSGPHVRGCWLIDLILGKE